MSVIWEANAAVEHDGKAVHSPVACPEEFGGMLCERCDGWFLPLQGEREGSNALSLPAEHGLSLVGEGHGPALRYVSEHQAELSELRAVVADLREAVQPEVMAELAIRKLDGLLRAAAQRRLPMTMLYVMQLIVLSEAESCEAEAQSFARFHLVVSVPCWMRQGGGL